MTSEEYIYILRKYGSQQEQEFGSSRIYKLLDFELIIDSIEDGSTRIYYTCDHTMEFHKNWNDFVKELHTKNISLNPLRVFNSKLMRALNGNF